MSSLPLLPKWFRTLGIILIAPAILLGALVLYRDFSFAWLTIPNFHAHPPDFGSSDENFTNELAAMFILVALLFIAFSRYKVEDEFISQVRLKALYLAVWVNYILLLVGIFLIYGSNFWSLTIYNLYTILIIYIITFYYLRYNLGKA